MPAMECFVVSDFVRVKNSFSEILGIEVEILGWTFVPGCELFGLKGMSNMVLCMFLSEVLELDW